VVKADAYGHGAVEAGRCLEQAGADALAVALPEEGVELREAGIRSEILLLGPLERAQFDTIFEYRLTPTVTEWSLLEELERVAGQVGRRVPFHLKVDTGMGRLGVAPGDIADRLKLLCRLQNCRLAGVYSHLACAENPQDLHTEVQRKRFSEILGILQSRGVRVPMAHLANSAAILDHPSCLLKAVRPGILLYGCHPSDRCQRMEIQPVVEFRTRVLFLKAVPAATPVGYGRTFRTARPSRIATLPVGYHDGLPRTVPQRGSVILRGRRAPFAGVVSMDLATVDVTGIPEVQTGDVATLVGREDQEEIRVEEVAAGARSIPYEILCRIGQRVPRVYHRSGVLVSMRSRLRIGEPDRSPPSRETGYWVS
jgi:alanine racemase